VEPQHVTELIPAYALGCLDTGDAELVERHLAACAVCRAEAASYRPITAQIALAAPLATPAPELRARLRAGIAAAPTPARAAPRPSWGARLAAFAQRIAPVWTPVSLLLIVGLLVANLLLWQTNVRPAASTLVTVQMSGTDQAPGARGVLSAAAAGQSGLLVVQGLPPLDASQQYQLWLVQDGQRTNGGVFSVDAAGFGQLQVEAPQPLAAYGAFGVTVEPAGGSPGPTGAKVLGGEL
jgi:anti-sigma-K factor RskA